MTEYFSLNAADVALIVGMVQCGLIAWGISEMRGSNKSRDATLKSLERQSKALELQNKSLEHQNKSLELQSKALERLLERTEPQNP